jgi:hypothetical protein
VDHPAAAEIHANGMKKENNRGADAVVQNTRSPFPKVVPAAEDVMESLVFLLFSSLFGSFLEQWSPVIRRGIVRVAAAAHDEGYSLSNDAGL